MNDLNDFQNLWASLDAKLDRNWNLQLNMIRDSQLAKVRHQLRSLIWIKSLTLAFYGCFAYLFIFTAASNWNNSGLLISSSILALWTISIIVASIHELQLITALDYARPVTQLQKDLSQLRLIVIRYLRLGVWIFPLYLCFVIQLFYWFWGIDILTAFDQTWIITQLAFSLIVMLPLAIWATRKLSPKNAEQPWMNQLLRGNGSQITAAMDILHDLEDLETIQD